MKLIVFFFLSTLLLADTIKVQSLACPKLETFSEAKQVDLSEYMDLNLFAMKHSCKILTASSPIEVINYDVNSHSKFIQVQDKKSVQIFYVLRKNVAVEQAGSNNNFKF